MLHRPRPIPPAPGQESVWDYPRPPRLERTDRHLLVRFAGEVIAETRRGCRVLETSHPPTYYFPPDDVLSEHLTRAAGGSICEWKGPAVYWTVTVGAKEAIGAAWSYPRPTPDFATLKDHVAFYCAAMEACLVDGELARPQPGGFYGGWVTDDVVGPFKGEPGTAGW